MQGPFTTVCKSTAFAPRPQVLTSLISLMIPYFFSLAEARAEPLFIDETESSGLAFEHFNGMSGELYFPEMMGSGAALSLCRRRRSRRVTGCR
jgi:hypothetical protein